MHEGRGTNARGLRQPEGITQAGRSVKLPTLGQGPGEASRAPFDSQPHVLEGVCSSPLCVLSSWTRFHKPRLVWGMQCLAGMRLFKLVPIMLLILKCYENRHCAPRGRENLVIQ